MLKRILLGLLLLLILIQFYNPNEKSSQKISKTDFLEQLNPPENIKNILKNSCYDCHSNQTKYPWYSHIAPISYLIYHHVEEGREHLNFSNWGLLSLKKKNHHLEEMAEEVQEGEMPLSGYIMLHPKANIPIQEKEQLIKWLNQSKVTSMNFREMLPQ